MHDKAIAAQKALAEESAAMLNANESDTAE
jgi:hypothetical protein